MITAINPNSFPITIPSYVITNDGEQIIDDPYADFATIDIANSNNIDCTFSNKQKRQRQYLSTTITVSTKHQQQQQPYHDDFHLVGHNNYKIMNHICQLVYKWKDLILQQHHNNVPLLPTSYNPNDSHHKIIARSNSYSQIHRPTYYVYTNTTIGANHNSIPHHHHSAFGTYYRDSPVHNTTNVYDQQQQQHVETSPTSSRWISFFSNNNNNKNTTTSSKITNNNNGRRTSMLEGCPLYYQYVNFGENYKQEYEYDDEDSCTYSDDDESGQDDDIRCNDEEKKDDSQFYDNHIEGNNNYIRSSSNKQRTATTSGKHVGFAEVCVVVEIQHHSDYTPLERELMYMTSSMINVMSKRNIIEYTYEKWNYLSVIEEDNFFPINGIMIHPAHVVEHSESKPLEMNDNNDNMIGTIIVYETPPLSFQVIDETLLVSSSNHSNNNADIPTTITYETSPPLSFQVKDELLVLSNHNNDETIMILQNFIHDLSFGIF